MINNKYLDTPYKIWICFLELLSNKNTVKLWLQLYLTSRAIERPTPAASSKRWISAVLISKSYQMLEFRIRSAKHTPVIKKHVYAELLATAAQFIAWEI